MSPMIRKEVVFVLGGPGSGKGTQCARVAKDFGYLHLSAGDLLREEQTKDSDLAVEIKKCIGDGLLVPDSTIVALLRAAIVGGDSERFLIDGFPRSRGNLDTWFQAFSDEEVQVTFTLFLECPRDALTERLLERGKTSGRVDDNLESALKRFDTFERETLPIVADLGRMGLVRWVSSLPARDVVYHYMARIFRGSEVVPPVERTLAVIKPAAVAAGKAGEIIDRVMSEGFVVVARMDGRTWSREMAEEFYKEHRDKPFFNDLVRAITSGPLVQLCLEKVDAIKRWRELMGPPDPSQAKASDPKSLRGLYGIDLINNGLHGSDSFASSLREVNLTLGSAKRSEIGKGEQTIEDNDKQQAMVDAVRFDSVGQDETTLALLKPGVSELFSEDILGALAFRGFHVLKVTTQGLRDCEVRSFFKEDEGQSWFEELRKLMTTGGQTTALYLRRVAAVDAWLSLIGPKDPREARKTCPESLRATYGETRARNAFHGSASLENARRELAFWFPRGHGGGPAPLEEDPRYQEMMCYIRDEVDPIVAPLLEEMLRKRPQDTLTFAAEYLGTASAKTTAALKQKSEEATSVQSVS